MVVIVILFVVLIFVRMIFCGLMICECFILIGVGWLVVIMQMVFLIVCVLSSVVQWCFLSGFLIYLVGMISVLVVLLIRMWVILGNCRLQQVISLKCSFLRLNVVVFLILFGLIQFDLVCLKVLYRCCLWQIVRILLFCIVMIVLWICCLLDVCLMSLVMIMIVRFVVRVISVVMNVLLRFFVLVVRFLFRGLMKQFEYFGNMISFVLCEVVLVVSLVICLRLLGWEVVGVNWYMVMGMVVGVDMFLFFCIYDVFGFLCGVVLI